MYDPDGVPVIAYFFPNGYGTKTNDNGCSNVIASLYGRDNFTSYLARAANEEKILYIDSEKYEQMEKELPRYGGTRFPPALAALSMDIIIPSSYICKMKAEINPKLSDREREHNSLNRTMHIKIADSRRNRLAEGQTARILTLAQLKDTAVDMFTTVYIGNAATKQLGGKMVTPRGYRR